MALTVGVGGADSGLRAGMGVDIMLRGDTRKSASCGFSARTFFRAKASEKNFRKNRVISSAHPAQPEKTVTPPGARYPHPFPVLRLHIVKKGSRKADCPALGCEKLPLD